MIYRLIKKQIERGRTDGLIEKINLFYKHDQLTGDQYDELMGMIEGESDPITNDIRAFLDSNPDK